MDYPTIDGKHHTFAAVQVLYNGVPIKNVKTVRYDLAPWVTPKRRRGRRTDFGWRIEQARLRDEFRASTVGHDVTP